MTELINLRGCGTALVTPFDTNGALDLKAFTRLVEFQIRAGIDFLIPCGTTGENPTLTHEEQSQVVATAVKTAAGRVPVIAGAGGYNTHEVIKRIAEYEKLGVQGILSVTPYYNKPTQEGLYQHYRAIAESTQLPIVLYNVPGRTGCNMEVETVVRLAAIPNIVAMKEASGNIAQICELLTRVEANFAVLSGDDAITLPLMGAGGVGVISVVSNLIPARVCKLVHHCLAGQFGAAQQINREIFPLFKMLFIESNPIPIKAALARTGLIVEQYRLPLVPMRPENRAKLFQLLDTLQIDEVEHELARGN
ncbi:MAG: 4-hydroxy-tetrahydrodipicolinate synthase [Acidobacteriota bacterium]